MDKSSLAEVEPIKLKRPIVRMRVPLVWNWSTIVFKAIEEFFVFFFLHFITKRNLFVCSLCVVSSKRGTFVIYHEASFWFLFPIIETRSTILVPSKYGHVPAYGWCPIIFRGVGWRLWSFSSLMQELWEHIRTVF